MQVFHAKISHFRNEGVEILHVIHRFAQRLQSEYSVDVHQHLIELYESFAGCAEFVSISILVSFPAEEFRGVEAEELSAGVVADADAECGDAVANLDVDVETGSGVTSEFTDESHDETFGEERGLAEKAQKSECSKY